MSLSDSVFFIWALVKLCLKFVLSLYLIESDLRFSRGSLSISL